MGAVTTFGCPYSVIRYNRSSTSTPEDDVLSDKYSILYGQLLLADWHALCPSHKLLLQGTFRLVLDF